MHNKHGKFIIKYLVYYQKLLMEGLKSYIREVLETTIELEPIKKKLQDQIPFYIREGFTLEYTRLYNRELVMAEMNNGYSFTTTQIEKQVQFLKNLFGKIVVVVTKELNAIDRKRFIQRGINFIVPGKQLFLPDLLIDLKEYTSPKKHKQEKLLPSAQYILLYRILHRNENINHYSFKQLAIKFGYTAMAITKAVNDLRHHELCSVEGTKEKYLVIDKPITTLWHDALPVMVSPLIKTVYTDQLPATLFLYNCNVSALPEYTDIATPRQQYYAIEKNLFHSYLQNNQWVNLNDKEGRYCLEVWKYNPDKLTTGITESLNVDPLSLYLSLKESKDERIEMALEQIIEKFIW